MNIHLEWIPFKSVVKCLKQGAEAGNGRFSEVIFTLLKAPSAILRKIYQFSGHPGYLKLNLILKAPILGVFYFLTASGSTFKRSLLFHDCFEALLHFPGLPAPYKMN